MNHNHDHAHEHDHTHHHHHGKKAPQALIAAIVVTIVFMVVEFVGGFLSNSLALISDAAHMAVDAGALCLSLFALWVARRPSNPSMTFGYHRAEILGALANGLAIWLIAGGLIYEAIHRLQSPPTVQGKMVFIIATIGLFANLAGMRILHSSKEDSINVRAAYLHLLSDLLGSVGAIIAGAVLWWTGWLLIDPIITVLFSLLMLASSWNLIKESIEVLMESVPTGIDSVQIRNDLQALSGVEEVHDLHIWSLSSGRLSLAVHLIVQSKQSRDDLLDQAKQMLHEKYEISHTTIQIEDRDHFSFESCYDCHAPQK